MKYKKLIDIASVVDSLHQTPKYSDEGIPMVRVTDVKGGRLSLKDCFKVDEQVYKKFTANHEPTCGDIVISRVGTYGNFSFVSTDERFCLGQNTAIITPHINPDFLYYCLISQNVKNQIEQKVVGSTQKTLSLKNIKELEIPDVDEKTQEKIAGTLRNLDEKIEVNSKINDNLLQQAQTIYRDMFITNANPSWRIGQLSDLITVRYGKDHKKLAEGAYPVYGSGGVMRFVERPLYDKESVLIPRKGTLNNVMYVNEPFWSVDTMFFTEMKLPNVAKFVFHFVKSIDLASLNAGSAVPSMTTDILNTMVLSIPDVDTLAKFESVVAPMYQTMQQNTQESLKLAELRESLLPRVMTGELDVSKLDI